MEPSNRFRGVDFARLGIDSWAPEKVLKITNTGSVLLKTLGFQRIAAPTNSGLPEVLSMAHAVQILNYVGGLT
jgi:hypothetical protein